MIWIKPLTPFLFLLLFIAGHAHAQETVTDYDGNIYSIKQIGGQVWMMENLNSTHDSKGRKIKRVCYDLIRENCDSHGGLYAWKDLNVNEKEDSIQGICPEGWHIPNDDEWSLLIDNLGGADSAAYFLGKDSSLFNVQYGGNYHNRLRNYNYLNRIAYYWTSSSFSPTAAWIRMIGRKNVNTNRSTVPKAYCLSVRCVKDKDIE